MKSRQIVFPLMLLLLSISPVRCMNVQPALATLKTKLSSLQKNLTMLRGSLENLKTMLNDTVQPDYEILKAPKCAIPGCKLLCWRDMSEQGEWYSRGHDPEDAEKARIKGFKPKCVVCRYLNVPKPSDCYEEHSWFSATCGNAHRKERDELLKNKPKKKSQDLSEISPQTRQAIKQTLPGEILFYDKDKPFYEFTNFWDKHPITIDGKIWPTTEHYFQAQKFINQQVMINGKQSDLQDVIQNLATPREVFDAANSKNGTYKNLIRADWGNEQVRLDVMHKALTAKFKQHPDLLQVLKSTGNSELVEASPHDSYWGWGSDKKGKNMLGKMLIQVRNELQ